MSLSLREQIEAKDRRRIFVPVQLSDPGVDAARARDLNTLALAAEVDGSSVEQLAEAVAARDTALAAVDAHFADVEFRALVPDEFEALINRHTDGEGDLNRRALCAELAAACAVDESVKDADWWAAQFEGGTWSKGEFDGLYMRLFTELNYSAPSRSVPKG